jgi:hypothetical protein
MPASHRPCTTPCQRATTPRPDLAAPLGSAILAALAWLALCSTALAQGSTPTVEKKYVLEWMVAGGGAAIITFLVIRSAHRADKPKEEVDLVLREPGL